MPDLSLEESRKFWSEYPDPMIYRVIMFMEAVEDWTLDGDAKVEEALKKLGEELDNLQDVNLNELGHEDDFIRIAANVKSSRGLRLLQAIDSAHPGSASRVLMHAEDSSENAEDTPGVFLRRNVVFERLRLLARVFSKDRLALVLRALEGEDNEY